MEIIALFENGVSLYRDYLTSFYIEHYSGPNVKQIPIRPDVTFIQELKRISLYLFKSDEMEYLVKTCRLAISEHIVEVNTMVERKNKLEKDLDDIRARAKKGNFKIGN